MNVPDNILAEDYSRWPLRPRYKRQLKRKASRQRRRRAQAFFERHMTSDRDV